MNSTAARPNGAQNHAVSTTAAQKHDDRAENTNSDAEDSDASDFSGPDDDDKDRDSKVLTRYRRLQSRRVDLVGDYAGDELFLIEGDSLLLRCFDDEKLDFDTGAQILHATYNVEHFLSHLASRKCHFNVVFFDSNRDLCVPPSAESKNASKYFLARAAIIRHLQANLEAPHAEIAVHVFGDWDSPDFLTYLQTTSPYFLMAHDGAHAVAHQSTFLEPEVNAATSTPAKQRVTLREMILSFISRGYNVALVNGLEWRDTKIMTIVLEARRRGEALLLSREDQPISELPQHDITSSLEKLGQVQSQFSQRELLAILTIGHMLESADSQYIAQTAAVFVLHIALLAHMPLSSRRLDVPGKSEGGVEFLSKAIPIAEAILNSPSWPLSHAKCDLMDVFDGRLFLNIASSKPTINNNVKATFDKLLGAIESLTSSNNEQLKQLKPSVSGSTESHATADESEYGDLAVLPFSNKVFDKHLESVRIQADAAASGERSLASRRVFQEVTHWHNYKRPIGHRGPLAPVDSKAAFWAARRNQWFMAEMRTYAASLTNAVGKSLEPETIIVGVPRQSTVKSGTESPADSDLSDSGASSTQSKGKPSAKKGGGGGKTAQKNAGKQAMLNQIAAAKAKKDVSAGDKIASSWAVVCKGFEADRDPRARYRKAKDYLTHLQTSWRDTIGAEIELYMLSCLLLYWIAACKRKEKSFRIQVAALIWSHTRSIAQRSPLPKTILKSIELTVSTLALPPIPPTTEAPVDRKLAFTFALPVQGDALAVDLPSKQFQLLECGPYLERSFDSKPDPRVDFQPDGWQRKVLDSIDADQSVFVVAPTSAGKTFISFYAMRKVLEADDDGVLVYVAPTKALVNQIAAEVQARYSKKFKYGGKSVWAIHTRDYRINNPTGCQVLVTVPHVLQIMLLAPSNANSWSSRVKRIIFDEIHSIGQAEDGVVWEQLLLMAPCPIIALSATVGNPEEFSGWLGTTQEAIGKSLVTVHHPYRYSDLRKYFYVPPKQYAFAGVPAKSAFGSLGLEGLTGFNFVHPVAGLVDKSRGIPEDLAMEPRDCFYLWQAMVKVQTAEHSVSSQLDPGNALPDVSRKIDILKWEKDLKELLRKWLSDPKSPYDRLVQELEKSFRNEQREDVYVTSGQVQSPEQTDLPLDDLYKTTLPMLCRLHEQDALPAILFNYDRFQCERICKEVVEQLESAELSQRKTGPKWEKTLEAWEVWKKLKAKQASSKASKAKAAKKNKDDDDEQGSKLDTQRDEAGGEETKWESFDPEAPQEGYHFADYTKVQASEFEVYIRQLRRRDIAQWLISSLTRGIGVHHAGMNRKYRQVVEILFRKGFLRVIVATGTLAMGINMPCKTVVFSGDSVFLTALNYRQCAGRAGRRGFDLLGNIVFQGVPRQKVCRLLSSRLPDLNGHFPITTTLVLRLFTLLHESNNAKYAVSAINALLSQPRLYMGGPSFKDQTMHHLRFSIEYLRRQFLLGSDGAPLNFAGLVSHLYFTENSSFAFHALLKEGYFHELCAGINTDEKDTLENLMLIMSHLFNRVLCRQADQEYREKVVKPSSSIVFLPPMPKSASEILIDHNKQTLKVFRAYVETFVQQHIRDADRKLPLSGLEVGSEEVGASIETLPPTHIRSSFVALSGAGDTFSSIHDLCQTTRDGVFLEEAVIPHMDVYPEEMSVPLNAYLLDFFKHGDVITLERANGIRRSDVWFLLNDFSLVLATIITSLMNFMKLSEGSDMEMLDVMGRMDAHEEEEDDKVAAVEESTAASEASAPTSAADSGVAGLGAGGLADRVKAREAPTKKQAKNADSWEDLAGDADEVQIEEEEEERERLLEEDVRVASWEGGEGGEGLKNVLKAFQKLHAEFNLKFKAMWA